MNKKPTPQQGKPRQTLFFPLLASAALFLAMLGSASAQFMKGTITGLSEGSKIYIYMPTGLQQRVVDSFFVEEKGKFVWNMPKKLERAEYNFGPDPSRVFPVVLSTTEKPEMTYSLVENKVNAHVSNSRENAAMVEVRNVWVMHNQLLQKIDVEYKAVAKKSEQEAETALVGYKVKIDSSLKSAAAKMPAIAQRYAGTLASVAAQAMSLNADLNAEGFYKSGELNDIAFSNTGLYLEKAKIYLENAKPALETIEQLRGRYEYLKNNTKAGTRTRELAYIASIRIASQVDQDLAVTVAWAYVKEFPNSDFAKQNKSRLPKQSPGIGDDAPIVSLQDANGKELSLKELRGKVVLLDFWASWCGPCRQENPNVVKAYDEFKDKGFAIFSVSLDQDREKWLAAITKDKLVWPHHVSDLKGWGSAGAALYGVSSIPATYLLDKNGKIIAKNLRGDALKAKLREVLQ